LADLSPPSFLGGTPTRSKGAKNNGAKERSAMRKVALDLAAKKITYCEVRNGQVVQRATVTAIDSLRSLLGPEQAPARVAIEACREAWYVHDVLSSWRNEVLLVDTTRSKQMGIGQHGRKTDRIDAEVLARAVERGGIPVAHVLSPQRRELRRQLGVRRALVESRSQLVTTVRGLAREQGESLPKCHAQYFLSKVRARSLAQSLKALIEPLLVTIEVVEAQLARAEAELSRLCAQEPVIRLLCTAPGVGPIVAASFVAVVDEARRFRRSHQLESYLGLVPGELSSGDRRRIGCITKKGNSYLRAVLVQSAWAIMRTSPADDPLRRWGNAVARRRGRRIAVIAVARRLAGILWAMWRDDEVYDPKLLGIKSASGLYTQAEKIRLRATALDRAAHKQSCSLLKQEGVTTN
jgi:transposase